MADFLISLLGVETHPRIMSRGSAADLPTTWQALVWFLVKYASPWGECPRWAWTPETES